MSISHLIKAEEFRMSDEKTTRWWEYYLPRYLMPSIAGAVMVNWLCVYAGTGMRALLYLPPLGQDLNTPTLILLFLYGNLFCYIASYPVLVFHATRVMDFRSGKREGRWPAGPFDGYILSGLLLLAAFSASLVKPDYRFWPAFSIAAIAALVQVIRIFTVLLPREQVPGHTDKVSPAFDYASVLARRRGVPTEETESEHVDEGTTTKSKNVWRIEFMDTYRHLREHGNSAFIFCLELTLAALAACVVTRPNQTAAHQLSALGVLFAVWAFPSAFVHLLAQHLERRFSRYDQKRPN